MKKIDFNSIKKSLLNSKFLKKYDYDINRVVGVKKEESYILFADKKLLRIYRGKLKSAPLLTSYIPVEHVMFYNFEVEKNILEKVDLDKFIETKMYEETGIDETEKYMVRYKLVDFLQDDKKIMIETVIVAESFIKNYFKDIVEKTGYIDYLSFPAFSYQSLYQEGILRLANDVFVVILDDKIFVTFYSNGKLVKIVTMSGGLDKIYEKLEKLNIANFDFEIFKKLLKRKGVEQSRYSSKEFKVYKAISDEFESFKTIIDDQIKRLIEKYSIESIDRVFITTKYGNIRGLEEFFTKLIYIDTFNFEFYENYNLDKLPIDPLLFLGMLETHYAYKNEDLSYNFSLSVRKPTFFYRPSGQLVLTISAATFIFSIAPLYLYIDGIIYEYKNKELISNINSLNKEIAVLTSKKTKLENEKKNILKIMSKFTKTIKKDKSLIREVYTFKYNYIPKSEELTAITFFLNRNNIYLKDLSYKDNKYVIDVFSIKDTNIANLIDDFTNNGFNISTDGITLKDKYYISTIRISE